MNEQNAKENVPNEMANDTEVDCSKRLDFDTTEKGIINQLNDLSVSNGTAVTCKNVADENDSGVDTGVALLAPVQLQRALSNNSGGYTSSSGGMDCQFASCNSSLLSVCSDSNEEKPTVVHGKVSNDCTSENGSESSSVSGDKQRQKQNSAKKRVALTEPQKSTRTADTVRSRMRAVSVNRAPSLATTERARSREKQTTPNSAKKSPNSPMKKATKPNTLSINEPTPRVTVRRAVSMSRRTPGCTPNTEDGRWPSIVHRQSAVNKPYRMESLVIKTKVGQIVLDNKVQTPDRYTTLPRRKRANSEEDLSEWRSNRSNSSTRDRMTSSTIVRRSSTRESPNKPNHPFLTRKPRTIIYHEALVQTALTSQDIDDAFAGHVREIPINGGARVSRECQADMRDKHIEHLEEQIRSLTADNVTLKKNLKERTQHMSTMEQQLKRERDEKFTMKQNTDRVVEMLRSVNGVQTDEPVDSNDSLLMLESQIQLSGHALEEKQCQIDELRKFCRELQTEMSRSVEERNNFEKETNELQDFLQDEKTAIVEALKDAETEIEEIRNKLVNKEKEVDRLQEECRHLVRICEQRRQEFLGMQSKYHALRSKSKHLLSQQTNANLTLSDLKTRLNELAEQLISSYSITERDLENEIHLNGSSGDSSPESEQKVNRSERQQQLITALMKAIETADQKILDSNVSSRNGDSKSFTTDMLDSETEPVLMIENVSQKLLDGDSLQNLCEAISNRRKIEEMMNQNGQESDDDDTSSNCEQRDPILMENIIDVNQLLTKLLKILQFIQIDNVHYIQQLIHEKNMLRTNKNGDERNYESVKMDLEDAIRELIDDDNKENNIGIDKPDVANQNNTITNVIETLNGIQSIVKQCPTLGNLQRDLELMLSSDCNGNESDE